MDALQSMEKYLSTRPTRFPSLESGVEWQYATSIIAFEKSRCAHSFIVLALEQSETQRRLEPQFHL